MRIAQAPARQNFSIRPFSRIGIFIPWIIAQISVLTQIGIVGQRWRDDGIGMFAIIALPWFKAAFSHAQPNFCIASETKSRHAIDIGAEMRFASNGGAYAFLREIITKRHFADGQRHKIPGRTM